MATRWFIVGARDVCSGDLSEFIALAIWGFFFQRASGYTGDASDLESCVRYFEVVLVVFGDVPNDSLSISVRCCELME